jgi:hypothetical protein
VIDIKFFSAAATVIPTLLVAVVFTGKIMDSWKLELDEATDDEQQQGRIAEFIEGITFVGLLLLASIAGQGAALAALVSGVPHFIYLVVVVVAIAFQLTCLGGIVLLQAVNRAEQYDARKANRGYALVGVGLVIFVLFILSATVSPETLNNFFK